MGACASLPLVKEASTGTGLRSSEPKQALTKIQSTKGKATTDAQTSSTASEQIASKLESARTGDSADSYHIRAEGNT